MALAHRTALATLAALVVIVGTVASIGVAAAPPASAANWAPVRSSDFPDPSILEFGGVYYAFATQNFAVPSQTINIQAATSLDGINWTPWSGSAVLPHVGSWAKPGNTWAPSVVRDNPDNDFVMYYTATETQTGDQCIGVATSILPTGPYTDSQSQPMVCQNGTGYSDPTVDSAQNLGGSIDPDVFTDSSTGDSYLIWKSDGNHLNPQVSTTLWSVRLGPGFLPTSNSTPTPLMSDDQAWQSGIVEGPDMVETQTPNGSNPPIDTYYLFYSGSDEGASTYAIGWASCAGPSGPCTDESTTWPLLTTSPGLSGPGGPDVYAVGTQLVMALAGWQGSTIGYLSCGIRPMYLADLNFQPNGSNPALPTLAPSGSRRDPGGQPELSRRAQARAGILAGRLRRRHLQLRRRAVLRLHRFHAPQQAGRRHGGDARRQRLLARGQRRRRLRLRRRAVLRLDREHHAEQTDHRPDAHARRRRVLADRQ